MKIILKNGNALINGSFSKQDIMIDKGKIKKIGKLSEETADAVYDIKGLAVMPALVDMHCHLRDPGLEHKEDIFSGSRAAVRGGYSSIACMPNTNPVLDNAALISYVIKKAESAAARVYPIGSITKGQKGEELAEIAGMKAAGAVAVSDDGKPVMNGMVMKNALEYASNFGLPVFSHCEDTTLSGDGLVNEGYNASIAGLRGITRVSEEAGVAREILLAEATGTAVHLCHISTKNSVDLVRQAKSRKVKVTAETCPHYIALTDSEILDFNTSAKINPPLREESDMLAVREGLMDGTIDAIATDHAPHHVNEKNVEFQFAPFGSTGLETAFAVCYTTLVKNGKMKIGRLIELMSGTPAKIMKVFKPEIAEGVDADLFVADLSGEFTVGMEHLASKSKNNVFLGKKFCGSVRLTMVAGKIEFEEGF